MYSRVTISTLAALQPEPLPAALVGLDNATLADLPAALDPVPPEFEDCGFWPVDVTVPEFDPREQVLTDTYELEVREDEKRVAAIQKPRNLTDEEKANLPPLVYKVLGKLEFVYLAQQLGGMTDEMLVTAQRDPLFAAFWIKFQLTSAVQRDDVTTRMSLEALTAGGYLPNGADAVLDQWPTL